MNHGHPRIKHAASIVIAGAVAAGAMLLPAAAQASTYHHLRHLHHLRVTGGSGTSLVSARTYTSTGTYSYTGLENLWESAGGPAWAAPKAAEIATCESGGNPQAYNPSSASGIWQILGQVVPGDIFNPQVNALNAVAKFTASGDNFSAWVCQ